MPTVAEPASTTFPPNATTLPEDAAAWTLANLREHLDGVPYDRIRLFPLPGTATEDDLLRINEKKDGLCELIDGVLVEKAMGWYESRLGALIIFFIESYLTDHPLGMVIGADGPIRLRIGRVRMPDVSFLSWDHFPERKVPKARVLRIAPELAVEVLSKSNTRREIARKIGEFFAAGTRVIWILDPRKRTARIHTAPDQFDEIDESGALRADIVLPGFALPMSDLFARAGHPTADDEADADAE